MAFITGLMLIDAPASALNNAEGEKTPPKSQVKQIKVPNEEFRTDSYPYVSAQAYRYWLRTTLINKYPDWIASKVLVGKGRQQAYTEGNPIKNWDDDLFGYMVALGKDDGETVSRVSPFRTSTFVSITPAKIVEDFGVMARAEEREGSLLFTHEFYRTVFRGLFSIDLKRSGTFITQKRTGFRNLGKESIKYAKERDLEHNEADDSYQLPLDERILRVQTLLRAMGRIEGGANQTLHYTDISPAFVALAVTEGGNNIFGRIIKPSSDGTPAIDVSVLNEIRNGYDNRDLKSDIYIGISAGFMETSYPILADFDISILHPRQALDLLADDLAQNHQWMD